MTDQLSTRVDTALLPELWAVAASYIGPEELTMLCDLKLALTAKFTPLAYINLMKLVEADQLNVVCWGWGLLSLAPGIGQNVFGGAWRRVADRAVRDQNWYIASGAPIIEDKPKLDLIWVAINNRKRAVFEWMTTMWGPCSAPKFIDALVQCMDLETLQWAHAREWPLKNLSRAGAIAVVKADPKKTAWLISIGVSNVRAVSNKLSRTERYAAKDKRPRS